MPLQAALVEADLGDPGGDGLEALHIAHMQLAELHVAVQLGLRVEHHVAHRAAETTNSPSVPWACGRSGDQRSPGGFGRH
jgi:hypothetical protein